MPSDKFGYIYIVIAKDSRKGYNNEKNKFQYKGRACNPCSNFFASLLQIGL